MANTNVTTDMLIKGTDIYAPKLIANVVKPVAGGHYYTRSFDKNTYRSCSCTIPLSKCKMTQGTNNKRVGYIGLGIGTEGGSLSHHFDVGLANAGDG